jgi:hypothetical protein
LWTFFLRILSWWFIWAGLFWLTSGITFWQVGLLSAYTIKKLCFARSVQNFLMWFLQCTVYIMNYFRDLIIIMACLWCFVQTLNWQRSSYHDAHGIPFVYAFNGRYLWKFIYF